MSAPPDTDTPMGSGGAQTLQTISEEVEIDFDFGLWTLTFKVGASARDSTYSYHTLIISLQLSSHTGLVVSDHLPTLMPLWEVVQRKSYEPSLRR